MSNWVDLSKSEGSGNYNIELRVSEHTGRKIKTGKIILKGDGALNSKTINLKQEAKPEFIKFKTNNI